MVSHETVFSVKLLEVIVSRRHAQHRYNTKVEVNAQVKITLVDDRKQQLGKTCRIMLWCKRVYLLKEKNVFILIDDKYHIGRSNCVN